MYSDDDDQQSGSPLPAVLAAISLMFVLPAIASDPGQFQSSPQSFSFTQPAPFAQSESSKIRNLPNTPVNLPSSPTSDRTIRVDLSDRILCYLGHCYPVVIGPVNDPTPTGTFRVRRFECTSGCTMLGLGFQYGYSQTLKTYGYWAIHDVPSYLQETYGCVGVSANVQQWLLATAPDGTQLVIEH